MRVPGVHWLVPYSSRGRPTLHSVCASQLPARAWSCPMDSARHPPELLEVLSPATLRPQQRGVRHGLSSGSDVCSPCRPRQSESAAKMYQSIRSSMERASPDSRRPRQLSSVRKASGPNTTAQPVADARHRDEGHGRSCVGVRSQPRLRRCGTVKSKSPKLSKATESPATTRSLEAEWADRGWPPSRAFHSCRPQRGLGAIATTISFATRGGAS